MDANACNTQTCCPSLMSSCLLCRDVKTGAIAESQCNEAKRLPAEQACKPCATFCDDVERSRNCNDHGTCADEKCQCEDGWAGTTCAVSTQSCASGKRDDSGACCQSGVLDTSGKCCKRTGLQLPVLDWEGACCQDGFLDKCGICGGTGFAVDMEGVCCEVRLSLVTTQCLSCSA